MSGISLCKYRDVDSIIGRETEHPLLTRFFMYINFPLYSLIQPDPFISYSCRDKRILQSFGILKFK